MSDEINPRHLPLIELAQRCAQETDRFFQSKGRDPKSHDPRYCLELCRRAIVNRDEEAWAALCAQYQAQVARWVYRHRYFPSISNHEEPQDFIAQAFERFWKSFTSDKFEKSRSLAAVLNYLQLCVDGAISDAWRKLRRLEVEQEADDEEQASFEPEPTPEELLQKDEFWQLIESKSKDREEYTVVFASFSLDLSPREILAQYPDLFGDIKEIYQYKANALARFENDPEIRNFFQRT